jgi:hypothetical protein
MIKIGNIDFTDEKYIIDIRDKSQVIKARVVMPDDAVYGKYLMKKDDVQFSFEYDSLVSFVRGDYIEYDGARFVLDDENSSVQENTQRFVYSLVFQADYMLLKNTQMYYVRQNLKEVSWSLTSDASSFIKIVVDNANRYFNTTDWQVGTVEPTGMKYINFDSTSVLDALTQIAEQFDAEWYITGKTINLVNKLSYGSEIDFESEVSVVSMARSEGENSTKFNRIVALGSTRNIPANYRQTTPNEGVDAIYQKRLRIPASKGDVIDAYPNMSPEEVVEGSVIFDDVYPQRTGTMSDITTKEYTDTDEETGVVTKWNAYRYKDTGLSFKESYILPGQELRIVFQSGKPNGMDFAVKFNPDGYPETDARSQVFEIVRSEDYGAKLPNDVIKPENGDKYILYGFDIQLVSDQYVPAAEQELYDKALEWLKSNLKDKSVYTCPSIINHFAENSMDLDIGQNIRLKLAGNNLLSNSNKFKAGYSDSSAVTSVVDTDGALKVNIAQGGVGRYLNSFLVNPSFDDSMLKDGDMITISLWVKSSNATVPLNFYLKKGMGYYQMNGILNNTEYTQTYATVPYKKAEPLSIHITAAQVGTYSIRSLQIEKGDRRSSWSSYEDSIRGSRIMGFEKKLYNIYEATYTVGDNATYSRLANIEKEIEELKYAGQIYQNSGGGNVYLIKQFDTTTPTDFNAYSAKASNARFLKRDQEDSALRKITFADGIDVKKGAVSNIFGNESFTSGQFGSGFRMWQADNGQSYAELDNLMVRREMIINTLTIAEIKSVGGQILVSLANMYVTKVEERSDSYRCFFETDNGTIPNQFAVDDQAICRKFNGQGLKYYWRRILAIGSDYIDLSKVDRDGSSIPAEGDEIIQFGNRTNTARQSAIMISAYGSDAPSIKQYAGVNTYNLTGKEVTVISPSGNKFTGEFKISTNGTTSIVYKDRGKFSNVTTYYLNDRVSYNGAYWVCIAPEGQSTSEIPSVTALYWRQDTTSQGDINNAIDNIEFGGRNLLLNSNKLKVGFSDKPGIVSSVENDGTLKIVVTATGSFLNSFLINPSLNDSSLQEGDEITISYWMKSADATKPFRFYLKGGMGYYDMPGAIGTDYTQISITVPYRKANALSIHIFPLQVGTYYLKYLQVEKGNKPSDWTPALEDLEAKIIQAQTDADTAKVNANTANLLLADIANDNKFVPSEKQEVKREWDSIISEYTKNISQASTFGISSTAYVNAYNSLNGYITPLLSNLNVTSDIVGTTFRNTFKVYYDARLDLLNAIAKKAKDLADAAQNTANQAQSGVTEVKASLVVLNDKIESKVSQSDFNSLQGRVSTSESKIEQQAGQIASTVEKVDKKNAAYKSYSSASTDHPSVPYSKGDIWITYDGRILQASNTRLSGAFIESDWVETVPSVNDIEFGGRNLLLNSNKLKVGYSDNPAVTSAMEADGTLRIGVVNGGIGGFLNSFIINPSLNDSSLVENEDITISYWMKCSGTATPFRFYLKAGMGYYIMSGTVTTDYKQFSVTVPYKKANTLSIHISPTQVGMYWLKYLQVEKGNKASDWSPASEDLQTGIDNAQATADSKIRTFYSDTAPSTPSGGFKVGDLWYKINTVDGCYETYRWFGSGWGIINVNVSKAKQVITDNSITNLVERTGINSLGNGETLYSKINQTAEQITLEVNKIQVGGGNLLRNSDQLKVGYSDNPAITSAMEADGTLRIGVVNGGIGGFLNSFLINPSLDDSTLKENDEVTISYWMRGSGSAVPFAFYLKAGMGYYNMPGTIGTEYTQISITVPYKKANGLSIHISPRTVGMYWMKCLKVEKGNKPSDWSPATGDLPNIVGSQLTLTDNKISLASTTIELTGNTIAKSIEAQDLKVGSRTGLSALEVLKDGTFYAKGSSGTNSSLVIDSGTQSIEIVSPYSASWNEDGGSTPSGKSTVKISSQTGGVEVRDTNNNASIVSTSGIFSNNAKQGAYPASSGLSAYGAIVGLGFGSLNNDYLNRNFIAGVIGRASNTGSAPAYGGSFDILKANGLCMAVRQISATTTLYKTDCYISCYNMSAITVYLPSSPYAGQVIYLRQMNSNGFTIHGNGTNIHTDGNTVASTGNRAGRGDTTMLVYDGQYWCFNYMPR